MNPATLPERKEHRNPVLERLIDQRTFGRVRGLRVNQTDSRVIVHGQAHSYYVVQLVVAAIQAGLDQARSGSPKVELDIQVRAS